jgi:serine/threonine-protein kinase
MKAQGNKTQVWKQASEVYADIAEMPVKKALEHLYGIKNISVEVKNAVITLINSGSQASQYFKDKIIPGFNVNFQDSVKVGDFIDGYELLESLGRGGMSQVFKAKRISGGPQKLVAIKIFIPRSNPRELLQFFIHEQQILAQFSHQYIVDMLHGGTSSDDTAYLVMELIEEALPLNHYCKKNKLPTNDKIQLIAQCAQALVYSHAHLIIHRDIKPDNILIDKNKQLKIVDFGIAKLISNDGQGENTTIMALTPNYAAPEQINSERITVRTDVFSLAIVALDLLCNDDQKPLPTDRLIKSCATDQAHLDTLIKSLKIDKDLKNILKKASQHLSHNRYSNMQLFYEDLNNYLDQKPVHATAPSLFYEVTKFAKRRSALFSTLLAFFVTLIVAVVFQNWQYQKTLIAKQEADEVKNFMLGVFSYANPEENIGQKLSALDLLSLADEEIKFKPFSDQQVKSDILSHMGSAFTNLGDFKKAENNLLESLQLDHQNLSALINLIQLYVNTSQSDKTAPYFISAKKILTQGSHDYALEQAELTLLEAENSTFNNDDPKGIKLAKQAQSLFTNQNNIQGILKSTRVLTEKLFSNQESQEPIDEALLILDKVKDKVSPVNTELLRLKTTLVWMYTRLGEYQHAKSVIDEVIINLRKKLGEKHPAIIDALVQRANVYKELGQTELAIKDTQESYASAQSIFGEGSQYAQQSLSMLAQLEFSSGNRKKAQSDLEKVVAMSTTNYGVNHRMTLGARIELSNYMAANGEMDAAIKNAQSTQTTAFNGLGEKHPLSIFATNVLLKLLSKQGVDAQIIARAVKNNANALEVLGIKHPQSAYSFFVLGTIYNQARQYEKANSVYKTILDNQLVKSNNPRYIALTLSISNNYNTLGQTDLAIEYASKSQQAAQAIFGKDSIRNIEASMFLLDLLKKSKKGPYKTILSELKHLIVLGTIKNPKTIAKIENY